ncbi:MAG: hypothetical protein ACLFNS_14580, partial [Desulfobacterales bacterium]
QPCPNSGNSLGNHRVHQRPSSYPFMKKPPESFFVYKRFLAIARNDNMEIFSVTDYKDTAAAV